MATDDKKHHILVPIDFSPHSEAALEFAMKLAEAMELPIIVLHVVHDPGESPGFYAGQVEGRGVRRMEDIASEMLTEFMEKFTADHLESKAIKRATTMLRVGLPVTRILEAVEAVDASMVVMGSLGRTGLQYMLIGSKAEQVVRLCPVPVAIVKRETSK